MYNINYSHSVIRVHTMFMCVLVYYVYIIFLAPNRLNRRASFHPPTKPGAHSGCDRKYHWPHQQMVQRRGQTPEMSPGTVGRVSQHLISPKNRGLNGEIIYKW